MKPRLRSAGIRNRRMKRTNIFRTALSDDELELVVSVAHDSGMHGGTWARDVLVSRALRIRSQRLLLR